MDHLLFAFKEMNPQALPAAQPGQNVWPKQSCPSFAPRSAVMAGRMRECWYCKYADFHLTEPVALEVGICCFPMVQSR